MAESKDLCMLENSKRENREVPFAPGVKSDDSLPGRPANLYQRKSGMNADGMADEAVVPSTRVNKAATAVAESAEERDLTQGKYRRIGVDASESEREKFDWSVTGNHDG